MNRSTPCECTEPGYCERHKMEKDLKLWHMCQRNVHLFRFWDRLVNGDVTFPAPAAALPRCQHRGLNVLEEVSCELCGNRQIQVPVYACPIHERCTERRFGNSTEKSRMTSACTTCSDYKAEPLPSEGDE